MHPFLEQLLNKRGLEDVTQLDKYEQADFKRWQQALVAEPITMEKLAEFIGEQKGRAENEIASPDNSKEKDMFLKASLNIYRSFLGLLKQPEADRKVAEEYLKQLLE